MSNVAYYIDINNPKLDTHGNNVVVEVVLASTATSQNWAKL